MKRSQRRSNIWQQSIHQHTVRTGLHASIPVKSRVSVCVRNVKWLAGHCAGASNTSKHWHSKPAPLRKQHQLSRLVRYEQDVTNLTPYQLLEMRQKYHLQFFELALDYVQLEGHIPVPIGALMNTCNFFRYFRVMIRPSSSTHDLLIAFDNGLRGDNLVKRY